MLKKSFLQTRNYYCSRILPHYEVPTQYLHKFKEEKVGKKSREISQLNEKF